MENFQGAAESYIALYARMCGTEAVRSHNEFDYYFIIIWFLVMEGICMTHQAQDLSNIYSRWES